MESEIGIRIAARIRELREDRDLTQRELADRLGFKSRQTVTDIENRKRRVEADELARVAQVLGVAVDHLTDGFRLVGEGDFSFRAGDVSGSVLKDFQERAGTWVATYRELDARTAVRSARLGVKLELTSRSSFEDARACAEALCRQWSLGDAPFAGLESAIARELGALVLYVDAPAGISGAALRLPGLHAILIDRHESAGRRNFDLAHELFHLLTWDAMPPKRVEPREVPSTKGNRVERLAENFAGALLMPRDVVSLQWKQKDGAEIHQWLNRTATALGVSALALKWRVFDLRLLGRRALDAVHDERLVSNGGLAIDVDIPPPLFCADFVRRVHSGIQTGRVSLRRVARLLDLSMSAVDELFRTYGLSLHHLA